MSRSSGVLVLLSGGVDSATCLHLSRSPKLPLSALFVDYGQAAAEREQLAASAVADHYGIELQSIRCTATKAKAAGEVPGRNFFLASLAIMETPFAQGLIVMGIHGGTPYWDCSRQFADIVQKIYDGYSDGRVRLSLPLIDLDKRQILKLSQVEGVPLQLTYSCETSNTHPCGLCGSCLERNLLQ